MPSNCRVCNRPLSIYKSGNQIYCDKSIRDCWKVGKEASQRNIRAQIKLEVILAGKICKRCQNRVYEPSMRYYCESCSTIMKQTGRYVKKQKKEYLICLECKKPFEKPNHLKKYCDTCKPIVVKRNRDIITERTAKETAKLKEVNKETKAHKKPIDPKWLRRN